MFAGYDYKLADAEMVVSTSSIYWPSCSSTNFSDCPLIPEFPLYAVFTVVLPEANSVPKGEKNDDRQQTHITKAIENIPIFPGLPVLSVVFLSKIKLTSLTLS